VQHVAALPSSTMSLTAARDQKTRKINNWDAPTHTKVQRLPTRKQWYSLLPCDLAPGSAQHVQCSPMSMPRAKQLWGPAAVGLLWVWVWVSCGAKQLWGLTHSKGTYHPHVLHHLGYHMLNTSRLFHSLLSVPRSSCKLEAMSKHDSSVMSLIDAQGILPKGGLFARSMPLPLEVADDGCLVPVDMSDSQSSDICGAGQWTAVTITPAQPTPALSLFHVHFWAQHLEACSNIPVIQHTCGVVFGVHLPPSSLWGMQQLA